MHIISVTNFPLFCSNSARKCLILPAECSPQKSLILLEILPAEFFQAYWYPVYVFPGLETNACVTEFGIKCIVFFTCMTPRAWVFVLGSVCMCLCTWCWVHVFPCLSLVACFAPSSDFSDLFCCSNCIHCNWSGQRFWSFYLCAM